ncbi:hypothetical protein T4B_9085 [Trichinella pseudospiralis]|uniref:Uncharacterized protein n=2 Tax=Trichinella pseudospiralis TaxID=6337 RepID=A0A0V1G1S7_TRIPS|nr:hypothetical protein T4A_5926 [Trichinella pseudospiralis]KRY92296.1 hypothetical protein T4D_3856 [Trichinella pseudospiralis]KRZ33276.1 hypothetical protein T4B_9085 [Trichinella pseudospiralis]KRZ43936.1 hypothetical protein T4C_115 [Trichinella pseudospiralis]
MVVKILSRDLEIYMNYLKKLREDFKVRFENLEKTTVPDWMIAPFDTEIENADMEFSLQEDHADLRG